MTRMAFNTYGQMVAQAKADEFERELKGAEPGCDWPVSRTVWCVFALFVVLAVALLAASW